MFLSISLRRGIQSSPGISSGDAGRPYPLRWGVAGGQAQRSVFCTRPRPWEGRV